MSELSKRYYEARTLLEECYRHEGSLTEDLKQRIVMLLFNEENSPAGH